MRNKIIILGIFTSLVLTLTTSINLHLDKQSSNTKLLIENIEALANDGEANIKVTTCIGKKTPCRLSDGTEGWGKPVQVSVDL